jgi:hypothetical protein
MPQGRKVWEGERPNQFRGLDFDAALDLLSALNIAQTLQDLSWTLANFHRSEVAILQAFPTRPEFYCGLGSARDP